MTVDQKQKAKQLFQTAKALRAPHESEISDAFKYTYPIRSFYENQDTSSADRTQLYDATAQDGVVNLVNTVMALLVPQNQPWAGIELRSQYHKKIQAKEVRDLIDDVNRKLVEHLDTSNFYMAASEAMYDCIISAVGALFCYDDGGALRYCHVPVTELYFTTNAFGQIDAVFREHYLSTRQLKARFPDLSADILAQCEAQPEKKHRLIESSIPKGDGTFRYCIYYAETFEELESTDSRFSPFIVFRWDVNGTAWGESPVRAALPHIRTLNEFVKLSLAFGEYAALGLWQTTDEALNLDELRGKMQPGSVLAIAEELKPVPFPGSFQISERMIQNQQAQISRLLLADPLPPISSGNTYMTATEISARQAEFYRRVGTPALRLEKEFLLQAVHQAIGRLQLRGDIAPIEEMIAVFGAETDLLDADLFAVVVTSAARKVSRFNEAMNDLQAVSQLSQAFGPQEIQVYVNKDKLIPKMLINLGVSPDILNTQKQIDEARQMQQQIAQAQQAIAMGNDVAKASSTEAQGELARAKADAAKKTS